MRAELITRVLFIREHNSAFPGTRERLRWSFDDPSRFTGTEDEIMAQVRRVRKRIKVSVRDFVAQRD